MNSPEEVGETLDANGSHSADAARAGLLYEWSYEETRERMADSLVLRWFCRVVELARQAKVNSGRKLRLDATCVQTTIHQTRSGLLLVSGSALPPREEGQAAGSRTKRRGRVL